jgi:hypothetical protein
VPAQQESRVDFANLILRHGTRLHAAARELMITCQHMHECVQHVLYFVVVLLCIRHATIYMCDCVKLGVILYLIFSKMVVN